MKNTDLRRLLYSYRKTGRAIPAFNYSDMWDLHAIVNSVTRLQVPAIIACNPLVAECLGLRFCHSMVQSLRVNADVPLFHHLDHSTDIQLCLDAIEAGYDSVMIDGSESSLEVNIRMVSEVVGAARRKDIVVEAEIGRIKGRGIESSSGNDEDILAGVAEAEELVRQSTPDMLAVGIGTAHGFYAERPKIHFDRLEEIAAVVDIPLVLHGGTGIPDGDIRKAIKLGISKINIGTIIHTTYMSKLRETLERVDEHPYTLEVMEQVLPEIERVIEDRIRSVEGEVENRV